MGTESPSKWRQESQRFLELALSGYEIALTGLPSQFPVTREFWFGKITLPSESDAERLEREISDAFFLRLKGLVEAQLKRLPGCPKPNWKSVDDLLSIEVRREALTDCDREAVGDFCAIRNCIAHNDGRVDEAAARRLRNLRSGSNIWLTREQLRDWFRLCGRMVESVSEELEESRG